MRFLYKLFNADPESREGVVTTVSGLGVIANIFIAAVKVIVGLLTSSVAIISEGINNASDALSAVLTLLGSKLSNRHPDEKHPFGFGRIEYIVSLVIAVVILISGVESLKSSVDAIFHPTDLKINVTTLIIIAATALLKFALGTYTVKMGKQVNSGALIGVGADSRNDAYISLVTIVSALVFLLFGVSIDAYAGIIMSLVILKVGGEILLDTLSELIGRPGKEELASALYKKIRSTPGVINAVDMMLHNYGPDRYSGSVNIEIDHEKTVGEVYEVIHALQLEIMREFNVVMVFGMYAVDNDHEDAKEARAYVAKFVRGRDHVKSYHAIYMEPGTNRFYVDLIVDYKLRDWDGLREEFTGYMKEKYPEKEIVLTLETEYV